MEEFNFQTLQQLVEEYYAKLVSSKEQDPEKNALFQHLLGEITVVANGMERVSPYEQHLSDDFITFWKNYQHETSLANYKKEFARRLDAITSKESFFELEIKSLDKYDLFDTALSGDIKQDGEKLGHLLAIKGDNPIISNLINELTTYRFGIERVNAKTKNELLQEEYWRQSQKNYSEIFRKLHWVCVGYLDAQKLSYVRAVQSIPVTNDETSDDADNASGGLTLKQQVLLIHRLGILDSPGIRDLTTQNQGKLFGRLFRRNEKNTEDLIRTRHGKNLEKRHSLAGKEVTGAVDALLDEIKLKL